MEMLSYELEFGKTLFLRLAVNVKNTKDVFESVLSGELECALIKPKLILDPFQIAVATNKAVVQQQLGKLITRSIYTEILYNLSPTKNIKTALQDFGVNDKDSVFLVAVIGEEERNAEDVCGKIDCNYRFPSSHELKEFVDEKTVAKYYKIPESELSVSNLLNSVVTRMSIKGVK